MKKLPATLLALAATTTFMGSAAAADYTLFDWATYKDGTVVSQPGTPGIPGILSLTFSGVGAHTAIAFLDAEINETTNTFFNEYGVVTGAPAAGQSWEIDEPGYLFGDIYDNFLAGTLDNSNGVPESAPDDVSVALGWDFILGAGETAVVNWFVTDSQPISGFYLTQIDGLDVAGAPSADRLYFYSTLSIRDGNNIPEPSMAWLFATAVAGLLWSRRRAGRTA